MPHHEFADRSPRTVFRGSRAYPIYHGPYNTPDDVPDRLLGVVTDRALPKPSPFMIVEHEDSFGVIRDRRALSHLNLGEYAIHTDRRDPTTRRRQIDREWHAIGAKLAADQKAEEDRRHRTNWWTGVIIGMAIGSITTALFLYANIPSLPR